MNKIAILLDNVSPKHINKIIFDATNNIYKTDKNSSINFFVKDINWPYRDIHYGIFKLLDYQNFEGPTLATNLELLEFVKETPNNNKVSLYLHSFPWADTRQIPIKNVLSLLTDSNIDVYCRVDYISELFLRFNRTPKVLPFEDIVRGILYGEAV